MIPHSIKLLQFTNSRTGNSCLHILCKRDVTSSLCKCSRQRLQTCGGQANTYADYHDTLFLNELFKHHHFHLTLSVALLYYCSPSHPSSRYSLH